MSKNQLKILIEEKAKRGHELLSWPKISKILNAEGPCIKSAYLWKVVNIKHNN